VANNHANMNIWNSRQIRRKCYDWPWEILIRTQWGLTKDYELLRFFYECPGESCECPCECLRTHYEWIDYTTIAWRLHINPLPMLNYFTLTLIHQPPPCECLRMPLPILWMFANALANIANACHCIRTFCENNENMIFARNLGYVISNDYEHLRMSSDHRAIIANWWRIVFVSPFATIFSTV
jgi:hypothetical protein